MISKSIYSYPTLEITKNCILKINRKNTVNDIIGLIRAYYMLVALHVNW